MNFTEPYFILILLALIFAAVGFRWPYFTNIAVLLIAIVLIAFRKGG